MTGLERQNFLPNMCWVLCWCGLLYFVLLAKYLCHRFKQSFSVTPQQYLLSVRMKKAKTLLKSSELKIKEISVSVGYKSQLTFSYAFKNHVGISPSEYREGIS